MAAVVAALGYQPPGRPPVEEMGDEGEAAQDDKWYGGVRGERRNSVGTKTKGSYHPKVFLFKISPSKGRGGLILYFKIFYTILLCVLF